MSIAIDYTNGAITKEVEPNTEEAKVAKRGPITFVVRVERTPTAPYQVGYIWSPQIEFVTGAINNRDLNDLIPNGLKITKFAYHESDDIVILDFEGEKLPTIGRIRIDGHNFTWDSALKEYRSNNNGLKNKFVDNIGDSVTFVIEDVFETA